jgi:hypothetical protein
MLVLDGLTVAGILVTVSLAVVVVCCAYDKCPFCGNGAS